jgi:hypothetical protein
MHSSQIVKGPVVTVKDPVVCPRHNPGCGINNKPSVVEEIIIRIRNLKENINSVQSGK